WEASKEVGFLQAPERLGGVCCFSFQFGLVILFLYECGCVVLCVRRNLPDCGKLLRRSGADGSCGSKPWEDDIISGIGEQRRRRTAELVSAAELVGLEINVELLLGEITSPRPVGVPQ
ncbi:hypothetical protein SKAU_G00191280, partial [Synaphobranchus kaupii]